MSISPAVGQPDGTLSHAVKSLYQGPDTKIHVLLPDNASQHSDAAVLYVLPVEPYDGVQCGDALGELRKLDLHNQHNLICVKPTFSHLPWYADHPSDPEIQQESHLLRVVVPFIDQAYCAHRGAPRRLLVGFSKSGWGALSLLLRNPQVFAKAAAFDAPLGWQSPNRYGMAEVFETQSNFDRYCVSELLEQSASALGSTSRLGIYGYSDFRGHHQFLHYRLLHFGIPHDYLDGPKQSHTWNGGWLGSAVEFLCRTP